MKNTRFNHILKVTDRLEPKNTWQLSYKYVKGLTNDEINALPDIIITEDNINNVLKAFKVPNHELIRDDGKELTQDMLASILWSHGVPEGFEIMHIYTDNERIEHEAQLEKLGLGDE